MSLRKPSVVSGFRGAAFRGVDFSHYITHWEDTREPSVVIHKYLKRDGGEAEYMGRKPHEVHVRLAFMGPQWMVDFKRLQGVIDDNPVGSLTHPIYGQMNAACMGYSGARVDIENAPDFYDLPLHFVESAVDTKVPLSTDRPQGPTVQQQAVNTFATNLVARIVIYSAAVQDVANTLASDAQSYAAAAVAATQALTPDPTLPIRLATVHDDTDAAIAAIALDPLAVTNPRDVADLTTMMEQLYDACGLVDDAVRAAQPQTGLYTVPAMIHITNLARQFYGKDGAAREAEILANNPGAIPDPGAIRAGTQLIMAAATFQR